MSYTFTKNNLCATIPKDIYTYPLLESIIIRQKGEDDINYKLTKWGWNEEQGFYMIYKTIYNNEEIKIDIQEIIESLVKLNVKSIKQYTRNMMVYNKILREVYEEIIITI